MKKKTKKRSKPKGKGDWDIPEIPTETQDGETVIDPDPDLASYIEKGLPPERKCRKCKGRGFFAEVLIRYKRCPSCGGTGTQKKKVRDGWVFKYKPGVEITGGWGT